ncbi:MAG: DNA mismatch repair protein MutS [Bacteroidota bacterium]
MQNDKTTLRDLSIFTSDGSGGIFALLDHTATQVGRDALRRHIQHPPDTYERLTEVQDAIRFLAKHPGIWPKIILNGTLVMLDKFYESADNISAPPTGVMVLFSAFIQKVLNKQEYFFTQFSLSHLSDFLKGCAELATIADMPGVPTLLQKEAELIHEDLAHRLTPEITAISKNTKYAELAQLSYKARREMKTTVYRLIASYAKLDAWNAMATATVANKWVFPALQPSLPVSFEAVGIRHPLLRQPTPYDITFRGTNFLLLTGANMSGKTTFMRALGVAALLAHLGMGVPAQSLSISFLQGIITNMQAEDNIMRGESYFFAEVQRMKQTAEKLSRQQPHLVLMDELFKGTNVHDAFECTKAVVEGLLNHPDHLMILSTHLYEVAQQFRSRENILFSYFVTDLSKDGHYEFTYELREGISNDRIGYLILQKEGVISLLNRKQ